MEEETVGQSYFPIRITMKSDVFALVMIMGKRILFILPFRRGNNLTFSFQRFKIIRFTNDASEMGIEYSKWHL